MDRGHPWTHPVQTTCVGKSPEWGMSVIHECSLSHAIGSPGFRSSLQIAQERPSPHPVKSVKQIATAFFAPLLNVYTRSSPSSPLWQDCVEEGPFELGELGSQERSSERCPSA